MPGTNVTQQLRKNKPARAALAGPLFQARGKGMFHFGFGELMGLSTALLWSISCNLHASVSRAVGPVGLIVVRAPVFLSIVGGAVYFTGVSTALPGYSLLWLLLSGFLAFTVCEYFFYSAIARIGIRHTLIIEALYACITAFLGWLFLGENLGWLGSLGIVVASLGVAWVVMDTSPSATLSPVDPKEKIRGVIYAFLAALALGVGMFLVKFAYQYKVDPLFSAFVRMCSVLFIYPLLAFSLVGRRACKTVLTHPKLIVFLLLGGIFGNLLGIYCLQLAFLYTDAGVAAILIAMQPIFIIPLVAVMERRLPSLRMVLGALISFAGIALVCLR